MAISPCCRVDTLGFRVSVYTNSNVRITYSEQYTILKSILPQRRRGAKEDPDKSTNLSRKRHSRVSVQ